MDFSYDALPGRVVFGRGVARTRIAEELDLLGLRSIILITGRSRPETDAVVAALAPRVRTRYSSTRVHVPAEMVEDLRTHAKSVVLDGIVCVGGGSAVGAAKALAQSTGLPIVAIPTTFAGSEVTPVWGMTTAGVKSTWRDPKVLPRVVVYDPELVANLPRELAANSALNAMAHCVDGFWAPGANPVSAALATDAITALSDGLSSLQSGSQANELLLYGAYLAGSAFAVTGSGLHHKICHALGGEFDLPHAELHAVLLPVVAAFNAPAAPAAMARIARALGVDDAVEGLRQLSIRVGAPQTLDELGLRRADRYRAITSVVSHLPIDNPRPVNADVIAAIIDAAFAPRRSPP